MYINIEGSVETQKTYGEWVDDFLNWLENRGENFGGVTEEISNEPRESDGVDFNRGSF